MAHFSRRQFIRSTLSSSVSFLVGGTFGSLLGCGKTSSKICPPSGAVLADLHVHPLLDEWIERSSLSVKLPGVAKLAAKELNQTRVKWKACHEARINVLCVAHLNPFDEFASMPTDPNPGAPFNTIRMMDLLEEELEKPEVAQYAKFARNRKELEEVLSASKRNPDNHRIAVVHTLEGGHALGGSLKPLEEFARRGVFSITITHFFSKGIASSANSMPFFPDSNSRWAHQGLSEFGRDVIRAMECLGITVDVTHATSTALKAVLAVVERPVIASHSGVRVLSDHPYNLFDEHIKAIARGGGIFGVALYPYKVSTYSDTAQARAHGTLQDAVRAICYVRKILDEVEDLPDGKPPHKFIGIGSDFGGYIPRPRNIRELGDIDEFRQLMYKELLDEEIVADIMANNVIEFMINNWGSGN